MDWKSGDTIRGILAGGISLVVLLAGCATELDGPDPEFSGEPGAEEESNRLFQPPFTCNEQLEDNWIELRGANFTPLVADSLEDERVETPHVTLSRSAELDVRDSGDKTEFTFKDDADKKRLRWISQERMELLIDEELGLKPGVYDVTVTNPTDKTGPSSTATKEKAFAVVPRPEVTGVQPELVCDGSGMVKLDVKGGPFLKTPDGGLPNVHVGDADQNPYAPESASDCSAPDSAPLSGWEICGSLEISIPLGNYDPGLNDVWVENPSPNSERDIGCSSLPAEDDVQFRVLRRPIIDSVDPSPICTDGNAYEPVYVTGKNFVIDTRGDGIKYPKVTIGGEDVMVTEPMDPSSSVDRPMESWVPDEASFSCSETEDIEGVYSCSFLGIKVPQGKLHEMGTVTSDDVLVDNPPGNTTCEANQPGTIRNAPPPAVDGAMIAKACGNADDTMAVEGEFHFKMGGRMPEVDVEDPNGNTVTYSGSDLTLKGTCSGSLDDTSEETEHCSVTEFSVKSGNDVTDGEYTITYKNPDTVQCSTSNSVSVTPMQTDSPQIGGIEESAVCSLGDTLTINGSNFTMMSEVYLDGQQADSVTHVSDSKLEATWMSEIQAGANPTLRVSNGTGCEDTTTLSNLDVADAPIPVFLDPALHYNGINVRSTLYITSGTSRPISTSNVQIRTGGNPRTLGDVNNPNPGDGKIFPLLPDEDPNNAGNPLPAGKYDVKVTETVEGDECGTWHQDLLTVTDTTQLAVQSISPQYGGPNSTTGVSITADPNAMSSNQFKSTPRVYLSAVSGGSGQATELSGVTFLDPTEITGTVPSGLNPGDYDVIVVNPNQKVGILKASQNDGFTITQAGKLPPTISNVNPGTWDTSQSALPVKVFGENFRLSSKSAASLDCDTSTWTGDVITGVSMVNNQELDLTVDATKLDDGDACELTVTNPNGSSASYSPIGTVEPAFNNIDFTDANTTWNKTRRWPAMSSGTPSSQQRFLYVLGGDDGGTGTIRSDGEFAQIDRFGYPQQWSTLPNDIPNGGRTLARAIRIRDFVYLVGGQDGSGTTGDIHRANVLDPQHNPDIDGLDFKIVDSSNPGLAPGDYFYRVSAKHTSNSSHNPDGETLASDVQPVSIPSNLGGQYSIQVQLSWTPGVSEIKEFRVYRTENPGGSLGDEKLLKTISVSNPNSPMASNTQFTDDGTGSFTQSEQPLPVGALGKWDKMGSLNTPREMHAVQGLVHPGNNNKAYIYAHGGNNSSGNAVDSIERIHIDDQDPTKPRSQQFMGVTDLTSANGTSLSSANYEHEALIATPANSDNLSGSEAYLYSAGGLQGAGANGSTTVEGWTINTDGTLAGASWNSDMVKNRAGHVGTVANNFLLTFGGHNHDASPSGDNSGTVSSGTGNPGSWNSLSTINLGPTTGGGDGRYRMGRASFVGFIYVGGGLDANGSALDSVEFSVVGTTAR